MTKFNMYGVFLWKHCRLTLVIGNSKYGQLLLIMLMEGPIKMYILDIVKMKHQ